MWKGLGGEVRGHATHVTAAETNAQLGTSKSIWMRYECVVPINHKTEKIPNIPTIIS